MTTDKNKLTIGQAIDQVVTALSGFQQTEQQTILKTVYDYLGISPIATPPKREPHIPDSQHEPTAQKLPESDYAGMDIKTFKELKAPTSARQMACVVAYYLAEIATGDERKESITSADIEKYFKQARFALPSKLEQLLIDCRGAGYFDNSSRGEYRLTRVGHNLVAHQLPSKSK